MKFSPSSIAHSLLVPTFALVTVGGFNAAGVEVKSLPENVTFTEHVAPILFQNCARCHRPGEAAPFALLNFQDAKKRGKQIAEVTRKRFMPPWHVETGHVEIANERRLTEEQIELIGAWHQQGMNEGDPAKLPALP